MPDLADMAAAIEAEHVARGLARVAPVLDPGVAGECEECGEDMPRLVGGRCGFCRDGRRHPFERAGAAPAPIPAHPAPIEEPRMTAPATADRRAVTIPAEGAVLHAIEERAAAASIPLGRAAIELIELGTAATPATSPADTVEDLLARLVDLVRPDRGKEVAAERDAAIARAEAAEAKLARLREALS